jgi:acetyl-CoA carboxylase biotin carboxyl carrier protein
MDKKELTALLRLMKREGVAEFSYSTEGVDLSVSFVGSAPAVVAAAAPVALAAAAAPAAAAPAPAPKPADGKVIRAPLVGTFYRAPSPDAPAYAKVGDRVRKGQVVCIVEAMKLMNQVESDVDGVVAEILVENGQAVQFGQELFRLVPG